MYKVTIEILEERLKLPGRLLEIRVNHRDGIAEIISIGKKDTPEGGIAYEENSLEWPEQNG